MPRARRWWRVGGLCAASDQPRAGITFSTGPTGSKVPLDLEQCAIFATPRVDHESTPAEVSADVDGQRLGGSRIFVETTRPVPLGENNITPFLTNVSFDVAAIC